VEFQELLALLFLKNVLLGELLNNNQDCYLSSLLHVLGLRVLTLGRYSVHYYLNHLLEQVLRLLFGDVSFGQVQQSFNSLLLDRLFAQHEHPGGQREDVDGDDIDDLRFGNKYFCLE